MFPIIELVRQLSFSCNLSTTRECLRQFDPVERGGWEHSIVTRRCASTEATEFLSVQEAEAFTFAGANVFAHLWRSLWPSIGVPAIEQLKQPMDAILADKVFCEEICRIVFSSYLVQLDRLVSDSLLNPKALGINV